MRICGTISLHLCASHSTVYRVCSALLPRRGRLLEGLVQQGSLSSSEHWDISLGHFLSTAETLGLSRSRHTCVVYAPDFVTRTRVASALDLPENRNGVVVAGSPVGKSDFVASFVQERTEAVEDLVDKLADLPLRHQDRFALLRKSMVPRLVHLVRTAPLGRTLGGRKCGPRNGLHSGGGGDHHWPRLQGQPHS
jgi:hypothetical protein